MTGSKALVAEFTRVLSAADWRDFPGFLPFVLPPFPYIASLATGLVETPVAIGAQTVGSPGGGPQTGEVTAPMIAELGGRIAEIGHAERRRLFGETDESVSEKVAAALDAGLTPLICIGETAFENEAGAAAEAIIRQAKLALCGVADALERCVLAYEPVWAIGETGVAPAPGAVSATLKRLREALVETYGAGAEAIPFLYGGSVNVDNVGAFAVSPHIDGLFVGRAAWTVEGYMRLARAAAEARAAKSSRMLQATKAEV